MNFEVVFPQRSVVLQYIYGQTKTAGSPAMQARRRAANISAGTYLGIGRDTRRLRGVHAVPSGAFTPEDAGHTVLGILV